MKHVIHYKNNWIGIKTKNKTMNKKYAQSSLFD